MSQGNFEALLAAISSDPVVRGEAAAFALVTANDADVSELEVGRYLELAADDLTGSMQEAGARFRALADAMQADPSAAADFARDLLTPLRGNEAAVRRIVRAARAAAVADVNLDRREEHALVIIGLALGTDAGL